MEGWISPDGLVSEKKSNLSTCWVDTFALRFPADLEPLSLIAFHDAPKLFEINRNLCPVLEVSRWSF